MKEIKHTKNLFLWAMATVYFFAFTSLYHQIPGLYGDHGLLPVRSAINLDADANTIKKRSSENPSLTWMAPLLGLDAPTMMELLAIVGMVVSYAAILWRRMREATNFGLLWLLYFSIYKAGQTFMWFQWDILLLEAGFLTILVAPSGIFNQRSHPSDVPNKAHDNVTLWLVKWLLFRLMFASGVVKLTSQCPTWWNLTALTVHFESQCLPTGFAWFMHHLPVWFLKLSVVSTYVIEIAIPFLFFSPLRRLRIFSFKAQVFFQVLILITGNYNFFNLLTLTLCISLLDDEYLFGRDPTDNKGGKALSWTSALIIRIIEAIVYTGLFYWTFSLFNIQIQPDFTLSSRIAFTPDQFARALTTTLPVTIFIGITSLAATILVSLMRSFFWPGSAFSKILSILGTVVMSGIAIWMFTISLVPHTVIDRTSANNLWPVLRVWHSKVDRLNLVNSYGLFRRMTGVEGRPEIIIEGSNSLDSGWREYHFLYKPGKTLSRPAYLVPHQPRLDWQMWFAALGTYKENPWLASLFHRILSGQPEVLALMDVQSNPFQSAAPKYLRAKLYTYKYTAFDINERKSKPNDWWVREKTEGLYFPVVSRDHQPLLDYLKSAGIPYRKQPVKLPNTYIKKFIAIARKYASKIEAPVMIWSLFISALVMKFLHLFFRI